MNIGKFVIPNYTIERLKCDLCHGYLSVPPIYSYRDKYACGRCNPDWERNIIYEQLAQYLVFPCMFCDKAYPWGMMQSHEDRCKQNKLACPSDKSNVYMLTNLVKLKCVEYHKECDEKWLRCPIPLCLNTFQMKEVLHHFNEYHKDYVFTNTVEARKIFKEEKVWNFHCETQVCLITWNTVPFLLFVHNSCEFDDTTGNILFYNYYFSVFTFCQKKCDMKYSATLQIQSDNEITTRSMKNQEVKTFNDAIHKVTFLQSEFLRLNSFDFMTTKFLKIPRTEKLNLTYSIKIVDNNFLIEPEPTKGDSDIQRAAGIGKHFECPICQEYMSPPIYNCATGHTICKNCKDKLVFCPYCKALVGISRNYVMEDMLDTLLLHCHNEYKGCTFTGKVQEIKLHEVMCHYN